MNTSALNIENTVSRKTPCFEKRSGQWTMKGFSLSYIIKRILILFFVLSVFVLFIYMPNQSSVDYADTFRPSSLVLTPEMRIKLQNDYKLKMVDFLLHKDPDSCGIAAPHMRIYQRYMIMHLETKLVDMFNPRYEATSSSATNYTFWESSLICKDPTENPFSRSVDIVATWDTATGSEVEKRLYDADAVCFQHMMDTFNGVWPCADNGTQLLIPYMYNVLSNHEDDK